MARAEVYGPGTQAICLGAQPQSVGKVFAHFNAYALESQHTAFFAEFPCRNSRRGRIFSNFVSYVES